MARKTTRKTKVRETVVEEPKGELEVEEVVAEKPPAPPATTETLMVVVTLAALITSFVLIRMKMVDSFGQGWPF